MSFYYLGIIKCVSSCKIKENSIVKITAVDSSLMDVAAVTLGETTVQNPKTFPISFELEYKKIESMGGQYGVNVRIEHNENLIFINDYFVSITKDDKVLDFVEVAVIPII
jgi:uncharacterized lipoprotein YbaY